MRDSLDDELPPEPCSILRHQESEILQAMPCALFCGELEAVVVGNATIFPGLDRRVSRIWRIGLDATGTGNWDVLVKSYAEVRPLRSDVRTAHYKRVGNLMFESEVPLVDVRRRVL
jgi:hypothetical protein